MLRPILNPLREHVNGAERIYAYVAGNEIRRMAGVRSYR